MTGRAMVSVRADTMSMLRLLRRKMAFEKCKDMSFDDTILALMELERERHA